MPSPKKTPASKPLKGRPTSTSSLAQPPESETLPVLSSFSPDGSLFAFATLAVDKHRIRVYNTATGRAVAEHTIDSGRVSALCWSKLAPGFSTKETRSPNKKRKKTRSEASNFLAETEKEVPVLVIGLSNGTVSFLSPPHAKIIHTLSHSTSTSSILALATELDNKSLIWTSSADSSIRLWDVQKNIILRSWKNDDRIPSTSLSVRPTSNTGQIDLLVAHHNIRLLGVASSDIDSAQSKPKQVASFTGHASPVQTLLWSTFENPSNLFFSSAERDRFIYVWGTDSASSNQKSIVTISLDSDVRSLKLATSDPSKRNLTTLSASGKLSFIPIPSDFPHTIGDKTSKIPSLIPRSTLATSSKTNPQNHSVIDFAYVPADSGSIRVVRLAKGVQPVFDVVRYLDDGGNYIASPTLDEICQESTEELQQLIPNKRYAESTSLNVGSGFDRGQGNEDIDGENELDGALQVDLAELSLGQRLTAVTEGDIEQDSDSEDNHGPEDTSRQAKSTKKSSRTEVSVIPANSLTRTLIQALHSSDSRLLEMCLAHSDPVLIRNTVRRLPSQLALPLITACVDRLGRGARASNMKGSGGGTSSQRGSGLLIWLRTVLAVHTGHLMTIPDLVARLSGLHSTLTHRLSLHDSLLSLSGRLDMVLSQVELRASTAPVPVTALGSKAGKTKQKSVVKRYVEGDTDSGDDDAKIDVQVEIGSDDEGSIEDIELGGESDEESDEADFSDSEDEGGLGSRFTDIEAEEEYSDEEDEDDSE